jgi:hypothetical protein
LVELLRIKSEGFELSAPLYGSVTKPLNSNAARQTTFDRRPDETRCQECERDRHVDLTYAAFLSCCDLLNVGHGARHNLVEPATTSGDCANEARAAFDPRRADVTFGDAVRDQKLKRGESIDFTG